MSQFTPILKRIEHSMNDQATPLRHTPIGKKNVISIIIPIRNEEDNISELLERIHAVTSTLDYHYEIIAIDDYSTDNSLKILHSLAKNYSLKVFKKEGLIGKGSSILEGIEHAQGEIIATIDADLAYPPEALPGMIAKLKEADIIVGNRVYVNGERVVKKFLAKLSNLLMGKMMFGLSHDVQSGIKVFKKEIVENISLNPSKWSFDLEFLLKATEIGVSIQGYDIDFVSRHKGFSKMNPFQSIVELFFLALQYKINPFQPQKLKKHSPHELKILWKKNHFKPYTNLNLNDSAIRTITATQVLVIFLIIASFSVLVVYSWHIALVALITLLTFIYFIDLIFNLTLIVRSLHKSPEIQISEEETNAHAQWPTYTIMCPLYKEWEVVPQFCKAIEQLDYPKDKLQVQLILEEDDEKTQEEVKKMTLPSYFQVLVTPNAQPKTKPKACNYALLHATGDYVVIYDAEDIPEKLQLKKAVVAFEQLKGQNVVCLQAKLNFYNIRQNILTRLFTLEYSLWFDLVLTGLHSIGAPIPLGGTSNHFKRKYLNLLQGWDPFNVTEDCDLGIRLYKYGYKTMVLDSVTLEEANSSFWGWFPQRSRWIKGYIQTYLVHMRRPHEFITDWNNPHILTFQLVVGGKVLSMWINPILWLMTIIYFTFRPYVGVFIESLYLTPVFYLAVMSLVVGNFLYLYYYMIGAAKREQWDLVKYAYIVPVYWLMISVASWKALIQIIFKPHYWEKTKHGLHANNLTQELLATG